MDRRIIALPFVDDQHAGAGIGAAGHPRRRLCANEIAGRPHRLGVEQHGRDDKPAERDRREHDESLPLEAAHLADADLAAQRVGMKAAILIAGHCPRSSASRR